MHVKKHTLAWILVLIMMSAGLASAVRKGRLVGRVVDSEDNPIEGVTVTATSKAVEGFNVVEITDRKGVFKVDFDVINVVYRYRFQKVGYQTLEVEQTWQKDGTARHEFTMHPGEAPTLGGVVPVSTSSPAISAFNAGARAFEAKDYATAVTSFEEAIGHDPEFHRAWGALSVALLEENRYQEAAEAAEKAIELGSTHETVLRTRWEAYRNLGDEAMAAEAGEALERSGRLAEEAKKVFNEAVALSKQGDYEGAFVKYQEASELDRNLQVALFGVATMGLKINRNEEALDAAEAILEADPENADAIRIRYNAALALGQEDRIIDALVSIASAEPEIAREGLWQLAIVAYDAQDMDRAKLRFGKLVEVDPNYAMAHYYLGLIYVGEGANDEAKKHLERFVQLAPDDPEAPSARDLIKYLSQS